MRRGGWKGVWALVVCVKPKHRSLFHLRSWGHKGCELRFADANMVHDSRGRVSGTEGLTLRQKQHGLGVSRRTCASLLGACSHWVMLQLQIPILFLVSRVGG